MFPDVLLESWVEGKDVAETLTGLLNQINFLMRHLRGMFAPVACLFRPLCLLPLGFTGSTPSPRVPTLSGWSQDWFYSFSNLISALFLPQMWGRAACCSASQTTPSLVSFHDCFRFLSQPGGEGIPLRPDISASGLPRGVPACLELRQGGKVEKLEVKRELLKIKVNCSGAHRSTVLHIQSLLKLLSLKIQIEWYPTWTD